MSAHLNPVVLSKGSVLYEAGERIRDIYMPEDGVVSYLSDTAEGETLEVGVIGNEGVVGIGAVLGDTMAFRAVVQIPVRAYKIKREPLRREFDRHEALHRLFLQYTSAFVVQVAQTAVCNKFHQTRIGAVSNAAVFPIDLNSR